MARSRRGGSVRHRCALPLAPRGSAGAGRLVGRREPGAPPHPGTRDRTGLHPNRASSDGRCCASPAINRSCLSIGTQQSPGGSSAPTCPITAATPQTWPAIVGPALKESPAGCCLDSAASPRFGPSQTPSGPRRAPPVRISISEGVVARANRALDPAKRPFCEPSGVTGACPAGARTPRGCSGFRGSLLILVA